MKKIISTMTEIVCVPKNPKKFLAAIKKHKLCGKIEVCSTPKKNNLLYNGE